MRECKGHVAKTILSAGGAERRRRGSNQARDCFTEVNCRLELSSVSFVVVANPVLNCQAGAFALTGIATEHLILVGEIVLRGNIDL